ncbi:hypothetical protein CBW65_09150 [Tumebacillus avium]|uniref:DUF3231 domain-containing protein n=1 Tax=Tumebacillus avium TaxID=1903704 RepID=A0A1Y0IL19_9BACL|nr:DUF3231 family protein [Tumebacillus avium]ARU61182.1 hypothetical protein CBW65_09150 [Tumebacillus avium]
MNLFEVLKDSFAPLVDGEKPPLHVGEAFHMWAYLAGSEETMRCEGVFENVVSDPELREKLHELRIEIHGTIIEDLKELLLKEGVELPPESESIPQLGSVDVPFGARPTDAQVANLIMFNLNQGIDYASRYLTNSLRADVAYLFVKIFMKKVTFAATFKPLMIKNGWLKTPPPYHK